MANITDVAREAGVSISTVSNVINGTKFVGEELTDRVNRAIEALGYQANELAASMKRRSTNNIGVVLPNIGMVFFPDVLKGIEAAAKEHGYKIFYFSTDYDFEKEKALIKQEFEEKRSVLMDKLSKDCLDYGFQVKSAQNGIYMMPVVNGQAIEEEEFNKLDDEIRQKYEDQSVIVQEQIMNVITQIKQIERQSDKKIEEWQSNVALLTVNVHINYIKSKYKRHKKINKFLNDVKADVLRNIPRFLEDETQNNVPQQQPTMKAPDPCLNYRVNLFVDNSNREGAPVIMDTNYTYQNIFGKLEYENYFGSLKTDHTMLKSGLLQQANGGYIIFQAKDLLANGICYETLKKALRVKQIGIENTVDQRSSMVMVSLKPEPIPLNLKVIFSVSQAFNASNK